MAGGEVKKFLSLVRVEEKGEDRGFRHVRWKFGGRIGNDSLCYR